MIGSYKIKKMSTLLHFSSIKLIHLRLAQWKQVCHGSMFDSLSYIFPIAVFIPSNKCRFLYV